MSGDHGPLHEHERDAAADLLAYSFPDDPAFAECARHVDSDRAFAVRRNGDLASVVLWRDTSVFHHHVTSTICIAGPGATHPAHRRQGVLAAAQEPFLAAMRDAGLRPVRPGDTDYAMAPAQRLGCRLRCAPV